MRSCDVISGQLTRLGNILTGVTQAERRLHTLEARPTTPLETHETNPWGHLGRDPQEKTQCHSEDRGSGERTSGLLGGEILSRPGIWGIIWTYAGSQDLATDHLQRPVEDEGRHREPPPVHQLLGTIVWFSSVMLVMFVCVFYVCVFV